MTNNLSHFCSTGTSTVDQSSPTHSSGLGRRLLHAANQVLHHVWRSSSTSSYVSESSSIGDGTNSPPPSPSFQIHQHQSVFSDEFLADVHVKHVFFCEHALSHIGSNSSYSENNQHEYLPYSCEFMMPGRLQVSRSILYFTLENLPETLPFSDKFYVELRYIRHIAVSRDVHELFGEAKLPFDLQHTSVTPAWLHSVTCPLKEVVRLQLDAAASDEDHLQLQDTMRSIKDVFVSPHVSSCEQFHLSVWFDTVQMSGDTNRKLLVFCLDASEMDEVISAFSIADVRPSLNPPLPLSNISESGESQSGHNQLDATVWEVFEMWDKPSSPDQDLEALFPRSPAAASKPHRRASALGVSTVTSSSRSASPMAYRRFRNSSLSAMKGLPPYGLLRYTFHYHEDDEDDSVKEEKSTRDLLKDLQTVTFVPQRLCDDLSNVILTDVMLEELSKHFPSVLVGHHLTPLFSTSRDGFCLKLLYRKMLQRPDEPYLLLIEDHRHEVFGAFLSHPMRMSTHFYGDSATFVFVCSSHVQVYRSTGKNSYFLKGAVDAFSIGADGGRNAIWIEETLKYGHSDPTATFDNPSLSRKISDTSLDFISPNSFIIRNLEVWHFI